MADTEKYQISQTYLHQLGTDLEQDKVILQHGIAPVENLPLSVWPSITHVSSDYAIAVIFNWTKQLCNPRQI